MKTIRQLIQNHGPTQAREIIYFLVRYFKQSRYLDEGGKDIFADVFDRLPTEAIRTSTLDAISAIETEVGRSAAQFDDDMTYRVLEALTEVEDELQPEYSSEDLEQASAFLDRSRTP